jgi:hypothetical protein
MTRDSLKVQIGSRLGRVALRFLVRTVRITLIGSQQVDRAAREAQGIIFSIWHGRLLPGAAAHSNRGTAVLVSRHSDGEIIARVVEKHGYKPVRGSTTRGGLEALREMVDLARQGVREMALTPDGPRGPRHVVQPGIVHLARRTGYAVVPVGASARPGRFLRSWDRFLVPYPFARLAVVYRPPIQVPRALDEIGAEAARKRIEEEMVAAEREADRRVGWPL